MIEKPGLPLLYQLPSELLYQIIDFVLASPCHTPPDGWRYRWLDKSIGVRNIVCYPSPDVWPPDALSLLLTSRKLYSETQQYLANTPSIARLDIAFVDFHWLCITWRNMPTRTSVIDQVWVNFIFCCTEEQRQLQMADSNLFQSKTIAEAHGELRDIVRGFVLDWIAEILPKTARDTQLSVDNFVVPRLNKLIIDVDTTKNDLGSMLNKEEVPLRKVDGLAHLDFSRLYPIDIRSTLEHMLHIHRTPTALQNERIAEWSPHLVVE